MKTSFVYFRSSTDSFYAPCFDTTMSRGCIIANLLACPAMFGNRDLLDYQFQFVGPYRYDKPRSRSRIYRIDVNILTTNGTIEFIEIPLSESLFASKKSIRK